jgi:16S rRNA (guanine527-N7)-methyltransferase
MRAGAPIALKYDVSRETQDRLSALVDMTRKWNPAINLVSRSSMDDLWNRHIIDSTQVFDILPVRDDLWADLGSGGGYPGLVVAALSAEKAPGRRVVLVESDQRKATFLRQAVLAMRLENTRVEAERIERLSPLSADVVSARALAPLAELCAHASRHLASGGRAIFLKGRDHASEVAAARRVWRFDLVQHPSTTDAEAAVLELAGVTRV